MLSVGYNEDLEVLEIEFPSKHIYQYLEVPPHVYASFMQAASLGNYFNNNIKYLYSERRIR